MFKLTLQPAPPEASVAQMFQSIPERSFGLDSILFVFCDVYLHLQLPIATGNEVWAADLSALRVFQRDAGRSASLPGPGGNLFVGSTRA